MPKELPVDRKAELMIRDDLVINYIEKSKQWFRNPFDEALTNEVEQLKKRVKDKWAACPYFPESIKQGVTDIWRLSRKSYKAVTDARVGGTMILPPIQDGVLNLRKMIRASFKHNGLIHCPPDKIPIIIDPTILTLRDGQTVKDEVWEIVKVEIEKRKNTYKEKDFPDDLIDFMPVGYVEQKETIKSDDFAVPDREPRDLAPLLRCKPEIFEKYLRWYDFMQEGLSFRLIALTEFHSRPEDREQKFTELIGRKKNVRNIGPVEEEDTVRKGVGLIYRAIFRKAMSARKRNIPTLKEYNCPYHSWNTKEQDWDCDKNCEYLKSYTARLSRFQ